MDETHDINSSSSEERIFDSSDCRRLQNTRCCKLKCAEDIYILSRNLTQLFPFSLVFPSFFFLYNTGFFFACLMRILFRVAYIEIILNTQNTIPPSIFCSVAHRLLNRCNRSLVGDITKVGKPCYRGSMELEEVFAYCMKLRELWIISFI